MSRTTVNVGPDTFSVEQDRIEVSSLHRPDVTWRHLDAKGHEHHWYLDGQPAEDYRPRGEYTVPSLVWVRDGEEWYDDDDEPHEIGHLECRRCGDHVTPGYTADRTSQYIAGLRHFTINDDTVTENEFMDRWHAATKEHGGWTNRTER